MAVSISPSVITMPPRPIFGVRTGLFLNHTRGDFSPLSALPNFGNNSGTSLLSQPLLLRTPRASSDTSCHSCLLPSPFALSFHRTSSPAIRSFRCHAAKQSVQEIEEEKEMIYLDAEERMLKSLDAVIANFNTIRTGRASPSLLDRIEVDYYGTPVILKSIAQISTPDGSTLLVTPFDKSSLAGIQKAIQQSDLGLNPSNDGEKIRLNIPQLTADRRKELVKMIAKLAEEGKVALRNVRRDAIKAYEKMEKDDKLSEDKLRDASEDIQRLTDQFVKKIDLVLKGKEKEITTV